MSKKLLEESTIRSFMRLANLQPLTDKFLKESAEEESEEEEEPEEEEEGNKEELDEAGETRSVTMPAERDPPSDRLTEEEQDDEEGDSVEEGKESDGRPGSPKHKVKGVAKPGKMDAAKNAPPDAKLKPAKQTHVHSDKPDSIEHKQKSNAPKKNNSQFEVMSESLEEMGDMEEAGEEEAPEAGPEMGSAGESPDHKEKMKGLIRDMLNGLKEMGAEYGMTMEISDEGSGPPEGEAPEAGPESPPPGAEDEEEGMMEEKLDKVVEALTKRVAARLVKETKKKR